MRGGSGPPCLGCTLGAARGLPRRGAGSAGDATGPGGLAAREQPDWAGRRDGQRQRQRRRDGRRRGGGVGDGDGTGRGGLLCVGCCRRGQQRAASSRPVSVGRSGSGRRAGRRSQCKAGQRMVGEAADGGGEEAVGVRGDGRRWSLVAARPAATLQLAASNPPISCNSPGRPRGSARGPKGWLAGWGLWASCVDSWRASLPLAVSSRAAITTHRLRSVSGSPGADKAAPVVHHGRSLAMPAGSAGTAGTLSSPGTALHCTALALAHYTSAGHVLTGSTAATRP